MPSASADVKQDASNACLMNDRGDRNRTPEYVLRALGMLANSDGYTFAAVDSGHENMRSMSRARMPSRWSRPPLAQWNQGIFGGRLWQRAAIAVSGSCW